MRYLIILMFLTACATPEIDKVAQEGIYNDLDPRHLGWSVKAITATSPDYDISVAMNSWGLLYLRVDDKIIAKRHNWCVRIVEYKNP